MSDSDERFEDSAEVPVTVRSKEEAALERARKVSELLDDAIRVPGTDFKVGLDPLLGVAPVSGDAISAGISLYVVAEAVRVGVPTSTIMTMLMNVAIDAVGGSVPVLGTVFDAVWKANQRNVELFEREIEDE